MNHAFLDLLRCPETGKPLKHDERLEINGEALSEELVTMDGLKRYPIENKIPRFASLKNYANSFGFQWNLFRKTQLDSYTGIPISSNRLFFVTQWPKNLTGQKILEAGSGAGRFTEVLVKTGAEIISFDYSNAVEANYMNNGINTNLL